MATPLRHRIRQVLFACVDGLAWWLGSRPARGEARPAAESRRALAVVKLDTLGDYVIFRNTLEGYRALADAMDLRLLLIANKAHRPLIEAVEAALVDDFIWVDSRGLMRTEPFHRYEALRMVATAGIEVVAHPTANRDPLLEAVVRHTRAKMRIGVARQKRFTGQPPPALDGTYTHLIDVPETGVFESACQHHFLGEVARLLAPGLQDPDCAPDLVAWRGGARWPRTARYAVLPHLPDPWQRAEPRPYALIAPGAGHAFKQWPVVHFAQLARLIHTQSGWPVVITGGVGDVPLAEALMAAAPQVEWVDLTGRTSVLEAAALVARAELVLSNDSAPVHLGAAFAVPTLCMTGGNHYGWWHPYPTDLAPEIVTCYPSAIEARREGDHEGLCQELGAGSRQYDVAQLTLEVAVARLHTVLERAARPTPPLAHV